MRARAGPALRPSRFPNRSPAREAEATVGAVCHGRPEAIRPARAPGRGWARQFYNLRAGSPRGAAFSCLWKAAGLRAGQRHASVLGTVPTKEGGKAAKSARSQTAGQVQSACSGAVSSFGAVAYLLWDFRAFVV